MKEAQFNQLLGREHYGPMFFSRINAATDNYKNDSLVLGQESIDTIKNKLLSMPFKNCKGDELKLFNILIELYKDLTSKYGDHDQNFNLSILLGGYNIKDLGEIEADKINWSKIQNIGFSLKYFLETLSLFNYPEKHLFKEYIDIENLESAYKLFQVTIEHSNDRVMKLIRKSLLSNSYDDYNSGETVKYIIKNFPKDKSKDLIKIFTLDQVKYSCKILSQEHGYTIITSQRRGNESTDYKLDEDNNFIDYKSKFKTQIKNGEILDSEGNLISTARSLYVFDKKGTLYVNSNFDNSDMCHSYFLNGFKRDTELKESNSLFGYGRPVLCAGEVVIKNGKVCEIDNASGHYLPDINQLHQTHCLLEKWGVLNKDFQLYQKTVNNRDPINAVCITGEIFAQYPTLGEEIQP